MLTYHWCIYYIWYISCHIYYTIHIPYKWYHDALRGCDIYVLWKRVATRGPFFSSADRQTLAHARPKSSHTSRPTHAMQSLYVVTEKCRKSIIGNLSRLEYMHGRNSVPTPISYVYIYNVDSDAPDHTLHYMSCLCICILHIISIHTQYLCVYYTS